MLSIYTDGACTGNPGPGGWACLLIHGDKRKELAGGEAHTTNNRMELTAAIKALEALKKPSELVLYSDSNYVIQGASVWLPGWVKKNWRGSDGAVKNRDLWEQLLAVQGRHNIRWQWVKGHAGDPGNERVDQLAREQALRWAQQS